MHADLNASTWRRTDTVVLIMSVLNALVSTLHRLRSASFSVRYGTFWNRAHARRWCTASRRDEELWPRPFADASALALASAPASKLELELVTPILATPFLAVPEGVGSSSLGVSSPLSKTYLTARASASSSSGDESAPLGGGLGASRSWAQSTSRRAGLRECPSELRRSASSLRLSSTTIYSTKSSSAVPSSRWSPMQLNKASETAATVPTRSNGCEFVRNQASSKAQTSMTPAQCTCSAVEWRPEIMIFSQKSPYGCFGASERGMCKVRSKVACTCSSNATASKSAALARPPLFLLVFFCFLFLISTPRRATTSSPS
mmetsp:Transcript_76777/g.220485  ORF Transcript_76777/g.220485 Transcript_76777/m.220485 type:complete len:318 (-) Transcript_76777:337-1290(-)